MPNDKPQLIVFGAPGKVGGAATKICDMIEMLVEDFRITVGLSHPSYFRDRFMKTFLANLGVHFALAKNVKLVERGVCIGICEREFFTSGMALRIKNSGMKLIWSNEMMWNFNGEVAAVNAGVIDRVLFVSELQRAAFSSTYGKVDHRVIPNFISQSNFSYAERSNSTYTIGRLSRADPVKFPMDFPVFYEEMGVNDVKFRIQAWSREMEKKFSWHRFDSRWEFFKANKIPAAKFLQGLDVFLYPLGHQFVESWGRVVAEAMLTGCVPVVPSGHQFHNIFRHGEHGFIFKNFDDYKEVVHELHDHGSLRREMGRRAADYARHELFNHEKHKQMWIDALTFD